MRRINSLLPIRIGTSDHGAKVVLCLAASLTPGWSVAQSSDNEATQLEPMVVTATRQPADALLVPAAVDVISSQAIHRAKPGISLAETLKRVPGVLARDRHNFAQGLQISIRGFGARAAFGIRGIRIYTDGIPATMPGGQGQVSHIMIESADRIEVLRGPFSALYGNSSGGVIAIFSGDAPPNPRLEAGFVAGKFGLRRSSLSFHTPWGKHGENGLLLDGVNLEIDGYRQHSAAKRRTGQALLKGQFADDGRYSLLLSVHELDALDPSGLTAEQLKVNWRAASRNALLFDARTSVQQSQIGVHVEQNLSDSHYYSLMAYAGNRDITQILSIPKAPQVENPLHNGGAIDVKRDYYGLDARWRWSTELAGGAFSLTTGVLYQVSDEHRLGLENFIGDRLGVMGRLRRDEQDKVTGRAVYAQAGWQPADRWRVHLGARYSNVRFQSQDRFITAINPDDSGAVDYSYTAPVAGVLFRVTPQISLYANAGTGFETPTFSELAYRSDNQGGLNDELEPAISRNVEVGLRARHPGLEYSATAFYSRTEGEIIVVANQGGRSIYDNAGKTQRRGMELALSAMLAPRWRFAANYTFLDARYISDFSVCDTPPCAEQDVVIQAGRRIPGIARHVAWSELRFSPFVDTDLMLQARYVGKVFVNNTNSEAAHAYTRVDLAAEQRLNFFGLQWRAVARINNLFDEDIIGSVRVNAFGGRYYEPAPGRNWMVGLWVSKSFD
ncbi:MAG: TonB-dependent receptor [Nitrococcus sp.]|nr:TonB-dependent receptor [Nitrococcus sp.]